MTAAETANTTSATTGERPAQQRQSRAAQIWLLVAVAILALLWLQTREGGADRRNLLLQGDPQAAGAEVFIDGRRVGMMERRLVGGRRTAVFYYHLPDGRHTIRVVKPGFVSFEKEIRLRREEYVPVDLRQAGAAQAGGDPAEGLLD